MGIAETVAPLPLAEVERIAVLARLTFDAAEIAALAHDLGDILGLMRSLEAVDVTGVVPTAHATGEPAGPLREDLVRPSLPVDLALAAAPERLGDGFGVPKMIE